MSNTDTKTIFNTLLTGASGRKPLLDWEAERANLQAMIDDGMGCDRIAKHYGCSNTTISNVLRKLGLRTFAQQSRDSGRELVERALEALREKEAQQQ